MVYNRFLKLFWVVVFILLGFFLFSIGGNVANIDKIGINTLKDETYRITGEYLKQEEKEIAIISSKVIKEEKKFTLFDKNIILTSEYFPIEDDSFPYILYTPSNIEEDMEIPLIVWLHGAGEVGVGEKAMMGSGLLKVLNNWEGEGFRAYVLCPILAGKGVAGTWIKENSRERLEVLMDKIIDAKNIDADKIIITGHSLGGQGALYMAQQLPEYFCACVPLSGYPPYVDLTTVEMPTKGFIGSMSCGEAGISYNYMYSSFASIFGEENLFELPASHGGLPKATFTQDKDKNNRSDILEWMLIQHK